MQLTLWWTKAKRAQSNTDNETWIAGGGITNFECNGQQRRSIRDSFNH